MRKTNRFLALLVAILMLTLTLSGLTACAKSTQEMVILCTNDVHGSEATVAGKTLGRAVVAQIKNDLIAEGKEVLLISAGDEIQGAPIVNVSKGEKAFEFMNLAGYDFMVPGNHEFDFGFENLLELQKKANFKILSANILYKDTGKTVFDAYTIVTVAGHKLGIFGLSTPETYTKAHPDNVKGLKFASGEELYKIAQDTVKTLQGKGCDLIICVGHLGIDEASAPDRSIDVINNTTGINLFIDGHSHSVIDSSNSNYKVKDTVLVSTGSNLTNVGKITYNGTDISFEEISAENYKGKVAGNVDSVVCDTQLEILAEYGKAFAKTEVDLNGTRTGGDKTDSKGNVIASFPKGEGNRVSETNLGDFATDAILWRAIQSYGDTVVASITNGGGIRDTIVKGNITRNDMITVFPFGNVVTVLTVTGSELLEALEAACSTCPSALGAFPQVSGITFTIDTTVPYEKGAQYPDSTYFAPAKPGSRVKNVTVGGQPLDLAKKYTIATNDFTAAGGDTFYAFKAAYQATGYKVGFSLEDALIDYVTTFLKGTIGSYYEKPLGRITIVK